MILFAHPYTAPDGTTRRPLAERVPECRPIRVVKSAKLLGYSLTPSGVEMDAACTYEKYPEPVEAALWRVAVEDHIENLLLRPTDHGQRVAYTFVRESPHQYQHPNGWSVGFTIGGRPHSCTGATRLDALNAAAHAVADAMGIAP